MQFELLLPPGTRPIAKVGTRPTLEVPQVSKERYLELGPEGIVWAEPAMTPANAMVVPDVPYSPHRPVAHEYRAFRSEAVGEWLGGYHAKSTETVSEGTSSPSDSCNARCSMSVPDFS
eukprot:3930476-Rhodomonas_salina.2